MELISINKMSESQDVETKTNMREALIAGEFGNSFRFWKNPEEVLESGYKGLVWFCQSERPGGRTNMDVPLDKMDEVYEDWLITGQNPGFIQIGENPPLDWRTMNAEIRLVPEGLELNYSTVKTDLRAAMKDTGNVKIVYGSEALEVLSGFMNENSLDDLKELLDKYPGEKNNYKFSASKVNSYESPVIEIMCFDRCIGTIPHRNAVIGEVRSY